VSFYERLGARVMEEHGERLTFRLEAAPGSP